MTNAQSGSESVERRLTPADLQSLRFTRAAMLRPGYVDTEVDRVMSRLAEELSRHITEKSALRDRVRALEAALEGAVEGAAVPQPPSEQALRILSAAQQTADNYVAEAEEFSRQMTSEARALYEEAVRQARENAGAILQAAQEAAAKIGGGITVAPRSDEQRSVAELQEQVAYLRTFGQAVRVQLRSYFEALISDVETEWGRADPAALPQAVARPALPPGQETGGGSGATFVGNTAAESRSDADADVGPPATAGSRSST
ncbi:MAG: DivIVA domain-containing protein [Blastococcus sp.]